MVATERSLKRIPTFMKLDLSVVDPQEPGLELSGSSTVRHVISGSPRERGACSDGTSIIQTDLPANQRSMFSRVTKDTRYRQLTGRSHSIYRFKWVSPESCKMKYTF